MGKQKKGKAKPQKKKNKNKPKKMAPRANPKPARPKAKAKGKATPEDDGPVMSIRGLAQFETQIFEAEKPAIVDFWAEWCGPCKAMAPLFKETAEAHGDDIIFAKVDTEASPDIAEELNITSLPTFLAFHEGKVIDMKVGVVMPVAMDKWIAKIKKKAGVTKEATPTAKATSTAQANETPEAPKSFMQKVKGWFGGGQ